MPAPTACARSCRRHAAASSWPAAKPVCVLQTALGLLGHGREVTLLVDATGSRKAIDHDTAVARLAAAGALPATVEMVAFEWLRSARHEHFRDALRHIKSPAIGHAAPGDLPRPD